MDDRPAPNNRLAQLIAEARVTYESLARDVRQIAAENGDSELRPNKSAVAHWVAGTRPHTRTVDYLVEALSRRLGRSLSPVDVGLASGEDQVPGPVSLPDDPVTAVATLGRADVDRRTLITNSVYSIGALLLPLRREEISERPRLVQRRPTSTIGNGEVQAVRDMTEAFNSADERLGGGHARSAVVEYLASDVASYLRGTFHSLDTRRDMFAAASQLAYLAGWKAHDLGLDGLAQRYYLHSYQLASESDPYAHAGYGLRILAHQAMDIGHRMHCVELADAALDRARGRVSPDTESLFWLTSARAHAANGSPRQALAALTRAEWLVNQAGDDEAPEWASLGGPAEGRLTNQSGKTLRSLRELPAAEEQLRRSARCWNPATHPRILALTLADLAETQCAQGKVEQACETWSEALDNMGGIRSARTRAAARSMRAHLASYRRRGLVAASRVDARASAYL